MFKLSHSYTTIQKDYMLNAKISTKFLNCANRYYDKRTFIGEIIEKCQDILTMFHNPDTTFIYTIYTTDSKNYGENMAGIYSFLLDNTNNYSYSSWI